MTPLIIWTIILLLILIILFLPLRLFFQYDDGIVTNRISIYNIKLKRRKAKKEKAAEIVEGEVSKQEQKIKKSPFKIIKIIHENFSDIMLLVHKFSKKILKSIVIENYSVHVIESSGDSASTAISFGYKSWIVNWFSAILSNLFTVKHIEIDIKPDFTEKMKKNFFSILIRIRLVSIICILFIALFNYKKILSIIRKFKEV